jgi:hypothetical protein
MPSVEVERGTSVGEGRGIAIQQREQENTAQHHNPQPRHMSSMPPVKGEKGVSI